MGISMAKIIPLVTQLGTYLKAGMDHYSDLRAAKEVADPEVVAAFVRVKIDAWHPEVAGRSVLDDATKDAGARFIAGIACNLAR